MIGLCMIHQDPAINLPYLHNGQERIVASSEYTPATDIGVEDVISIGQGREEISNYQI